MSILKSILHHYNKTTKSYDTLHPETESAQITDWNKGIVNTLASTALGGLVNTLTSDSLLAKMIQKVLTATGVKYNIAQNGYVCLGTFFGGLIIQWGVSAGSYGNIAITVNFPVAFSEFKAVVAAGYENQQIAGSQTNLQIDTGNLAYIRVWPNNGGFGWIAIGR